nr:hypothetical protein [uncultured Acetatifactor sp.]
MKIAVCNDSMEDRGALREACGHGFEIRECGSGAELYADMGYTLRAAPRPLRCPCCQRKVV